MTQRPRRSRRIAVPALVSVGGCVLILGIGVTSASFTDRASVRLNGDDGLGGKFDIAVVSSDGTSLEDAATEQDAMNVALTPSGTAFTKDAPLRFDSSVENRNESVPSNITVALYDPDPEPDDLFALLRFDVTVDDKPIATSASADAVNALAFTIDDVAPGERHNVNVAVSLDRQTPRAYDGRETAVGLTFDGATR